MNLSKSTKRMFYRKRKRDWKETNLIDAMYLVLYKLNLSDSMGRYVWFTDNPDFTFYQRGAIDGGAI